MQRDFLSSSPPPRLRRASRCVPMVPMVPMDSKQAAEFLALPYNSFRELAPSLAPSLPRHAITPARFGYLRRELPAYFGDQ